MIKHDFQIPIERGITITVQFAENVYEWKRKPYSVWVGLGV